MHRTEPRTSTIAATCLGTGRPALAAQALYALAAHVLGQVDKVEVKDGRVLVHSLWPGPRDPRCCPSVKRSKAYAWQGSRLVARKTVAQR